MDDVIIKPKAQISAAEMQRRRLALRDAEANNRLGGQFSSPETAEVFEAFVHGEIELHEITPRIKTIHHRL